MSSGSLRLVFASIVETVPLTPLATSTVGRHRARAGTADTRSGATPKSAPAKPSTTTTRTHRMTAPCLAIQLGHRRQGVNATSSGFAPTGMSVGCFVLVFTSIVDTESVLPVTTKTVLPSGVTATAAGSALTGMSVGCLVLVLTSIVDTEFANWLVTNAVDRHCARPTA